MRLILEQTMRAGIPVWLIDPEGEYVSLREKFDVVIFGDDGGDLPVDAATLSSVLPPLLKKGVSCVFDLSECRIDAAIEAIRAVGDCLMEAPKSDWKPLLLALDEAQKLAPEGKTNPAMEAVSDVASRGRKRGFGLIVASRGRKRGFGLIVASRGRKRGFGLIVATQRLSALDKNITTQLLNRFIGLCLEDIEINRASGYIGKKNAVDLIHLESGDFFALGSAFSQKGSVRFHAGSIETTHPNSAARQAVAVIPPAGSALNEIIAALREKLGRSAEPEKSDVAPVESSIQSDTEKILRGQMLILEREVAELRRKTAVEIPTEHLDAVRQAVEESRIAEEKRIAEIRDELKKLAEEFARNSAKNRDKFTEILQKIDFASVASVNAAFRQMNGTKTISKPIAPKPATAEQRGANDSKFSLSNPQQKILDVLALFRSLGLADVDRSNVAVFAGVSPNSGAFKNNLGVLRNEAGKHGHPPLIEYHAGERLALTGDGLNTARNDLTVSSNTDLHEAWFRHLRSSKKQAFWKS